MGCELGEAHRLLVRAPVSVFVGVALEHAACGGELLVQVSEQYVEWNLTVSPASLANAIQYLVHEWAYRPVAFVSYGGVSGGTRGVQMAKQLVTNLKMMPIPEVVSIPFFAQYFDEETRAFAPGETQEKAAVVMLDELLRWTEALRSLRAG